ncbi:hypothetical protein HY025_02735 [Candidatus Daviesbacteria bacterium]|nr:hypothetical protein [Candidatus Daviesbacteria bacterium]
MTTTQDHLSVQEVKDDIVILKDGSMAVILQTSAVNFGLLSENEQLAIISAFAALLNSLSFSFQIIIRSKKLDISSYLKLLEQEQIKQTNNLLSKMMANYRQFIEKTVRENEVLDKQFYLIISVSGLELGITKDVEGHFKKGLTILLPRRDHIIRQLWRTGLKATQLNSKQLVNLFYDIYNPPQIKEVVDQQPIFSNLATPEMTQVNQPETIPVPTSPPEVPKPQIPTQPTPLSPQTIQVTPQIQQVTSPQVMPIKEPSRVSNLTAPFVVEELGDDYGVV